MATEQMDFDMDAFELPEGMELEEFEEIETPIEGEDNKEDQVNTDNKKDNNISDPPTEEEESVANEDKENLEDKEEDSDDGKSSSQKLYSSLASALAEEGILSSLDENTEIKSSDDLFGLIKTEIQKNRYADLNEDQKSYLKALESGIPKEEFHAHKQTELQLESIEEQELTDNAELRKAIIIADFKEQGIAEERAIKLAQRSIDLGEDLEDAKEALASIKVINKSKFEERLAQAQKEKADAQKRSDDEIKQIKDTLFNAKEIIPGLGINEKVKKEVYDQMVKPIFTDEKGVQYNALTKARLDNPVDFTVKLHYLFKITNGFEDFDKLKVSAKSKAVKDLDNTLKGHTFIPQGDRAVQETDFDVSDSDFKNIIDQL